MPPTSAEPADPAGPDADSPDADSPDADNDLSYEQARDELVETVRRLETGGTTLAESLALWERGERLAGVCQRFLDGVRARLDAASEGPDET